MAHARLAAALLSLLAVACVGSIQPIYTDRDLIADTTALGAWHDSASSASALVTQDGPTAYDVLLKDDEDKTAHYKAHLARVAGMTLLDLTPEELPKTLAESYRDHFLPLHSFYLIELQPQRLVLRGLEPDSLAAFLERTPAALAHVRLEDGLVLTADARALQLFLQAYRQRSGVLGEPEVWKR